MELIRDLFIDSFRGDTFEKLIGVISWFLLVVLLSCIFVAIDSSFAHTTKQRVKVISKEFIAAHTTFIAQVVGKSTIMTPIYHPDSWYVTVSNNGYFSECKVDNVTFHKVSDGQVVYAYVGSGLITNQEYCDTLHLIKN